MNCVEENQAYRNLSGGGFEPMPGWALNDIASGRGMTMADLDNDGDLDIVVNNLGSPAKLFENRLCGGDSIMVDLRQPGVGNGQGIGARLTLTTDSGVYRRDLTAVSGYLSGDSSRAHIGFPSGAMLERLTILWNDGEYSEVIDLSANTKITVARD